MNTTALRFRFISDPGHGWIEVSLAALSDVGLKLADISRYSYRKGDMLYLEEDCDAMKFVDAFRQTYLRDPEFNEVYQANTFVRRLPRIEPVAA